MKILEFCVAALLLLLVFQIASTAQRTYLVNDFSDRYSANILISEPPEDDEETWISSKGSISIIDKVTGKVLIRLDSERLAFDQKEGRVAANVIKLPYGEQSPVIYEDINFDGRKDFALMDGHNSCYGGPSFQVYLSTISGFKHSPAFTRLAQEYCGMFDVEVEEKKIRTMTKSGCCWHQYSEFIVRNNTPVAMRIMEESMSRDGLAWDYVEKNRVRGRMVTKSYSLFNDQDNAENIVFTFALANSKKMRLVAQQQVLSYVFTDKDDKIELVHSDAFHYSKDKDSLTFAVRGTRYSVGEAGIVVTTAKGKVEMPAAAGTAKGSIQAVENTAFENVTVN